MKDIVELYSARCKENKIPFRQESSVLSYDGSTLFCPAGMQQFKSFFTNPLVNRHQYKGDTTLGNIQPCIRLNDINIFGDGSHLGVFHMIGLFSFRDKSLPWAVDFWWKFLLRDLGIKPTRVTLHPDKYGDPLWRMVHDEHFTLIDQDKECKWSDGTIGGYCTEFYVGDLEIGNIVYPLNCCIDVGFGLERLDSIVNHTQMPDKAESLRRAILAIIDSGVKPSNIGAGYVLRKLLRTLHQMKESVDHIFFIQEKERQERSLARYAKLKEKYPTASEEWWFDTHGIDIKSLTL